MAVLASLDVPACGCPTAPLPCPCPRCKACRKKHPDRKQAADCEACPILPPPCEHILDADHRLDCKAWAALLAKYDADYREPPRPASPTAARPGSEAKIEMMAARHARGEHLYHVHDVKDLEGVGSVGHRAQNGRELEMSEAISLGGLR